jgi:hypothetical protein
MCATNVILSFVGNEREERNPFPRTKPNRMLWIEKKCPAVADVRIIANCRRTR